jgi:hypothetical protein
MFWRQRHVDQPPKQPTHMEKGPQQLGDPKMDLRWSPRCSDLPWSLHLHWYSTKTLLPILPEADEPLPIHPTYISSPSKNARQPDLQQIMHLSPPKYRYQGFCAHEHAPGKMPLQLQILPPDTTANLSDSNQPSDRNKHLIPPLPTTRGGPRNGIPKTPKNRQPHDIPPKISSEGNHTWWHIESLRRNPWTNNPKPKAPDSSLPTTEPVRPCVQHYTARCTQSKPVKLHYLQGQYKFTTRVGADQLDGWRIRRNLKSKKATK